VTPIPNIRHTGRDLWRAISLIWQADRAMATLTVILQVILAILPVLSLYYIKAMVETITGGKGSFSSFAPLIVFFSAIQFLQALAGQYVAYINTIHQQKLSDYLSGKVLHKAIEVDYAYYENPAYHDTLHLAQQQSLYKATLLLNNLNTLLLNSLSLLFLTGFFFTMHSQFALFFVILSLPLAVIKWYSGFTLMRLERRFAPLEREADYLHQTITGVASAKEVRVLGYGQSFIRKFNTIRSYIHDEKRKLHVRLTWYSLLAETAEIIAMAFIFFLLAKNTWEKTISIGLFVIYIQGFQRLQNISKSFLQSLVQVFQQRIFLKDLFTFFDIPSSNSVTQQYPFPVLKEGLVVQNASFAYPQSNKEVLHNINLQCAPGKIIAIVGENGSGKSTLVKLLARLYPLQQGNISISGTGIGHIEESDFRNHSIFLFQDFEKYFLTVEEIIVLGDDSTKRDTVKIEQAATLADAHNFITKLSKGYQTRMGRIFEGSEQLSGGQWQKLALARVFYKNASMIVLDEPTSALDAHAEFEVFKNLQAISAGKVIILITHRLYNLKMADCIYVMQEGNIVEKGSFEELVSGNGPFRQMYEVQKL